MEFYVYDPNQKSKITLLGSNIKWVSSIGSVLELECTVCCVDTCGVWETFTSEPIKGKEDRITLMNHQGKYLSTQSRHYVNNSIRKC